MGFDQNRVLEIENVERGEGPAGEREKSGTRGKDSQSDACEKGKRARERENRTMKVQAAKKKSSRSGRARGPGNPEKRRNDMLEKGKTAKSRHKGPKLLTTCVDKNFAWGGRDVKKKKKKKTPGVRA